MCQYTYPLYSNDSNYQKIHVGYMDHIPQEGETFCYRSLKGSLIQTNKKVITIMNSYPTDGYVSFIVPFDKWYYLYLQQSLF